jgi:hypothetical protein
MDNWNPDKWQGRSEENVKTTNKIVGYWVISFIGFLIFLLVYLCYKII